MNNGISIASYVLMFAILIWTELFVCKRAKKHKGLIIPMITAAITVSLVLTFWRSSITVYVGDNSASAVTRFLDNPNDVRNILLLGSIPSVTLFVIYSVFMLRRKRVNRELKKIDLDMLR